VNVARAFTILRKDLAQGPRSPFFLWILVFPLVISFVFQAAFGAFLQRAPTMGVVADDDSLVLKALTDRSGLVVVRAHDADTLWAMVDDGEVDMGWVVPSGFEAALKKGEKPLVDVQVGGDALASHRIVLALATAETVRHVHGDRPVVEVAVVTAGEERARSLLERLLPLAVLLAILISGIFLPAFSFIDERQKGALTAILVTPTTIFEVMLAKGTMGFVLAIVSGSLTLAMNGAFPSNPVPILVVFVLAAAMVVELGLIVGALVKNTTVMFTIWKSTAWILMLPVASFVWSGFPQWVGMLSPTYWFMKPTWDIAVEGRGLIDVAFELGIAGVIIILLTPVVVMAGRHARRTIGEG
jgi:ABC-2 type transport system permease protein